VGETQKQGVHRQARGGADAVETRAPVALRALGRRAGIYRCASACSARLPS
jgi:hypothetical protein